MAVAMLALTLPPAYVSGIIVASVLSRKAWSKLLVHAELHPTCIHETFAQTETARSDANRHGIGPITIRPQFEKVLHYIDSATSQSAMCSQGTATGEGLGAGRFDRIQ
jgi:aldehyde dehydrogenase (NAD+)